MSPRAPLATHEAIAELAANDPPEVRVAYERLLELGHDEHAVRHALADALVREIWRSQREHVALDRERYAARLAATPDPADDAEEAVTRSAHVQRWLSGHERRSRRRSRDASS